MNSRIVSFLVVSFLFCSSSIAQSTIFGKWKTIDDETGKPKAIVDIYERDGELFGKIIQTFPEEGDDPDPICTKCEGEDKDQKVIGMEIIRHMKQNGDEWEDGTILDAEHGRTYNCKLWIEEGVLKVRGYVAFFYRTQEWLPFKG